MSSNTFKTFSSDDIPFKYRHVSSANCVIFISVFPTAMHFISLFSLIFIARISTQRRNRSAEIGQPTGNLKKLNG